MLSKRARSADSRRRVRGDVTPPRATAVVSGLVDSGLLAPERAEEAHAVVRSALLDRPTAQTPLRRRLAEVAGYVGGALVVAAAVIFLIEEWDGLSTGGQVTTLTVTAAVLFGAAVAVVLLNRRGVFGLGGDGGVRRRLASALATGGAVAAAFAVGVLVEDLARPFSDTPWAVGALALVAAALAGYRLAPSALGQVAMAVGALVAVLTGLTEVFSSPSEVVVGSVILALGVVWLVLAELDVWWERHTGLVLGGGLLLLGGQFPTLGSDHESAGYLLTALVAVATVVLYTRLRAVPYLVTAVTALTLVVPEILLDWTDGSLGPVGALLATGVTLLVSSLLGLRLRQEVGGGPGGRPGGGPGTPRTAV